MKTRILSALDIALSDSENYNLRNVYKVNFVVFSVIIIRDPMAKAEHIIHTSFLNLVLF
jgi:hypothetical protein